MINKYFCIVVVVGTILLSACSAEKTEQKVIEDKTVEDKVIVDDTTELNLIELSSKEEEGYSNFQKDLNLKHLSGLEPISIAKLYIKAGFDKKYDVQYALYTDREGYVQWSKEEDEKIPESDRGSDVQNIKQFNNIDKGAFVQTSDYEGYIEYDLGEGTNGFQMIKNEDGVWQVAFMPIQ
ncbi:RNA polymerase subunit sigma [Neobacillus sp. YX16]|uniref:RNA polymerase subunit sigma n=1 Tax=Neobacillus sp. YX16 TaxID=3047874 RepID=UPI0024C3C83B|nr:RNA polymerase subunit sigma [Neobacillus sp. YX16]WHZ02593.1 RNA polymerase subunit sigma [Neobacillus sp. YX16]